MSDNVDTLNAEVIAVYPNKVRIKIHNLDDFRIADEKLAVGSYLRISDSEDCAIIAIIENFAIELNETKDGEKERVYIIESIPIGFLDSDKKFSRGGSNIAIPPTKVRPAKFEEIQKIYNQIEKEKQFLFSSHALNKDIKVPVDGDKFFNKHIGIVGATGSGKSHTITKIIQEAVNKKSGNYAGLNNSHIIIFDIHSEYKSAFPNANYLNIDNLVLPYWLMNGEELEELFIEHGEGQAYNQTSLLRRIITRNKQMINNNNTLLFDSPIKFNIDQVLNCIINLSEETRNQKNSKEITIVDDPREFKSDEEKFDYYFEKILNFSEIATSKIIRGTYNDKTLEKFISRLKNKTSDKRLSFLLGKEVESISFEETLRQFLGYKIKHESNVTIIDLNGVPFEVLSITVSLISRVIFEYGYYYRKAIDESSSETPILLVYEEAHKYVPKLEEAKYKSSRIALERIAKEGRKYGITMVVLSQRPSEVSETIFSQCNNFIAMRLTNPTDQAYVKKLLPDSLEPLTESLTTLEAGQGILIGDASIMPTLIKIDRCNPEPSSHDIRYLFEWEKEWLDVDFKKLTNAWSNQ